MPTPGDAYVVPNGAYGFQVVPPVTPLNPRSIFTLRNLTDSWIHASFPLHLMSPAEGDIEPRGRMPFTVLPDAAQGIYEYYVTIILVREDPEKNIKGITLRASGGSDPRIIIDF